MVGLICFFMGVVRVEKGRAAMGDAALQRDRLVMCSRGSEKFLVEKQF